MKRLLQDKLINKTAMLFFGLVLTTYFSLNGQCNAVAGEISGIVFEDMNGNGVNDDNKYLGGVLVNAFDEDGLLADHSMSNFVGEYVLEGLDASKLYRVEFRYAPNYKSTRIGADNQSDVRRSIGESCDVNFGLRSNVAIYGENPNIALTCFVQGPESENTGYATIVGLEHDFNNSSPAFHISDKFDNGSVWGLAYNASRRVLYSSAFVKQYATLTSDDDTGDILHDVIFKTSIPTYITSEFVRLSDLGVSVPALTVTDVTDCEYGVQVGRKGLGGIEMSEDGETLYVINIANSSIVAIDVNDPSPATTVETNIVMPASVAGKTALPFALKQYQNKLYIGVTVTGEEDRLRSASEAIVITYNLDTEVFETVFSTSYILGFWDDLPGSYDSYAVQHWFTDIDFLSDDKMVIGLTDRKGHKYCRDFNVLDDQSGDILMVYKDANGVWTLESDGMIFGNIEGQGRTHDTDGPGGGEFFGHDFFPLQPNYHNEIALGGLAVLPGSREVITAVFDPIDHTYSGGIHRYSGIDGSKVGAKELYVHNSTVNFGKATGFGGVEVLGTFQTMELGNIVWLDEDGDGVQDPNEIGIPNLHLSLYNDNCTVVGQTTTDTEGHYLFNDTNVDLNGDGTMDGVDPFTTYYIVIDDADFNTVTSSMSFDNKTLVLTEKDLGHAAYSDGNDSDASFNDDLCPSINDLPVIIVNTGVSGDNNHTYDFGFTSPGDFDLALKKEVVGNDFVRVGDKVDYKITIFNQGELAATDIVITDYIPEGMRYEEIDNPGWTFNGNKAKYTLATTLDVDNSTEVFFHLYIKEGYTYADFINYAEISSAKNLFGDFGDDIDSTPDEIANNDAGGVPFQLSDNAIDEDSSLDEDDQDPAAVRVFDLALTKQLVNVKPIYMPGDIVEFEIKVWNQGNVDAKDISIVDYIPQGMELNALDWFQVGDYFEYGLLLLPSGQQVTIPVALRVGAATVLSGFVNYAEISGANLLDGNPGVDFDSTPNNDPNDDIGGDPYGVTDNEIDDNGSIDEDDHDGAYYNLQRFDLALRKIVVSSDHEAGELAKFEITVINQGTITADDIEVVDYLPSELEFIVDPNWTFDPVTNKAICLLSRDNGLLPIGGLAAGQSAVISITTKIKNEVSAGLIVNNAEIASSMDINGVDRTNHDVDSQADQELGNDIGGDVNTELDNLIADDGSKDEDDQDPAALVVVASGVEVSCFCMANSSNTNTGQYGNTLFVESSPGEKWTVVNANGLEQANGSASTLPDLGAYILGEDVVTNVFPIGISTDSLGEVGNGGTSFYYLEGFSISGYGFTVVLSNGLEEVTITQNACTYVPQTISGPTAICAGSTATYCVDNNVALTYEWNLPVGGVIVGVDNGTCITVDWANVPGLDFELNVENSDPAVCMASSSILVDLGLYDGGEMACVGDANISLGSTCELLVTPELVLQGIPPVDVVYDVIVMDPQGNMLPEPIITAEHIGIEMVIKVIDVCTGNSCWTHITVSDKMAPVIDVADVTIDCNGMVDLAYPPAVDNCGGPVTIELTEELFTSLDCNLDFTYEVLRTFVATDQYGNSSDPVSQTIFLRRIDVNNIVFPDDRTVANANPVFCQQYDIDEDGNPAPSTTGVPTYNGVSIFPYTDQYCSVGIGYTDQVFQTNGCVEKIMRTWTAYEWWCGQAIIETFIQEINIADQTAPQFEAPASITVTTNSGECVSTVILPTITPVDDCSTEFELDIQYPGGFVNNSTGTTLDFDLGESLIIYTIYDGCLNSSSQSFTITVVDNTPPVMVCEGNTVISLKADGTAYAPASVFDDGSIVDCSPLTFEVKRMDDGVACGLDNTDFGPYVEFCCADAGQTVQVILRATDADGNSNSCMVNAFIQDKNPPVITVPADLTIECEDPWEEDDLAAFFGEATAIDNCVEPTITETSNISISECNTGFIVRTFVATDGNGTDVGTQTITVVNSAVFVETDIDWPDDFETDESCNAGDLTPDDLDPPFDYPILSTDACDNVEFGYTEMVFQTTDNSACAKIIRTWMVMDMCNLDTLGNPTMFIHDQTIVITNDVAPEIITSCDSISSSQDADCVEGFIELTASATDDCTDADDMQWSYNIDLDQNGSFDITQTGVGGTISYSGVLPLGTHTVIYQWEDRCGNSTNCSQVFTIFNDTPPLAKCQDLTVELTPVDTDGDNIPDAEVASVDVVLIGGDSENLCGLPITLSYDVEGDSTIAVFDCFDLGINTVTVYVTDANGLQSSCTATIIVQDNNNVDICPTPEDCIVWAETPLVINTCVANLDPITIGSETTITEPCVCDDYTVTHVDVDMTNPLDACAIVERTWTVTFNCFSSPLIFTNVQLITQLNASAPVITNCPPDASGMSTNAACTAFVNLGVPTVDGSCSFGVITTNDSPFANNNTGSASGDYPVGTTTVIYTVTDECGNASTCELDVIVDDLGAPICNAQDITVTIPASGGTITIPGNAIDNNSVDDCGTIVSYSVIPDVFSCNELGDNTVVMTVTDQSGNTSTCSATVTVEDLVAPICSAGTLTITLFSENAITILGQMLDNGSVDTCGFIVAFDVTPDTFDCDDIGVNDVVFTVTDNNGNTSSCPTTVTVIDGVAPICNAQDITVTLDGNGEYVLQGSEVDNGSEDVCGTDVNFTVSPDTFDCDDLGDNPVVLTVTDAAGNSSTCSAIVTVTDTLGPTCLAGTANITLFSPTEITLPASFVDAGSFDDCGEIDTIFITPNVFGCDDIGENIIILTVVDDSGNVSTCEATVNVADNIPPTAVSMDITVNIETSGFVVITGEDIDNGSFDDCGEIVNYMATPDTFDCTQLGDNIVVLKVTDNSGNTATTTATVTVESPNELLCIAQNITAYLDENGTVTITPEEVDNGSMAPCGSTVSLSLSQDQFFCNDSQLNPNIIDLIVTDDVSGEMDTCSAEITVLDTLLPVVTCPIDVTFACDDIIVFAAVDFSDNCPGGLIMDTLIVETLNDCGIGTIDVTYSATDLSGNIGSCTYTITIENNGGALFTEANITWPDSTITITDCSMTSPTELMSFPVVDLAGVNCANIGIDFTDMSVGMSTMCIDTIQRSWTVVDSCQLDGSGAGVFNFDQFLFLDDSDIPFIQGLPTDTTVFVTQDSCDIYVDLSAAFINDCSMTLVTSNDSPFANNPNSIDASGVYPLGTTTVEITSLDACGNTDTFNINVIVVDTIAPLVDCLKQFVDITDDGTVTIFPENSVFSLSDNCSDSVDISVEFIFGWDETDPNPFDNPTSGSITYDCDDLGMNLVSVLFVDENGNYYVCTGLVLVSDPNDFCSGVPVGNVVAGDILSFYGQAIPNTTVSLSGSEQKQIINNEDGMYSFNNIEGNGTFEIKPTNNNKPNDGVTTLDVLIIQKHVMGMDPLDNPYDIIAADVNKSGNVSGSDMSIIQQLILGDIVDFPNNNSFRFVPKSHDFIDESNPFITNFPESSSHTNIQSSINEDFVGIKIADVNGSYDGFQSGEGPDTRTVDHDLYLENMVLEPKNGFIEIPVYSRSYENLEALEMTLKANDVDFVDIKPGLIDIYNKDFSIRNMEKDLKISWINTTPVSVSDYEVLFTIVIRSSKEVLPIDVISMTDQINDFYNGNYGIANLRFANERSTDEFTSATLYQNTPNPWTNETLISFDMVIDADYILNFYTIDGRLIHTVNGFGTEGYNEITVSNSDFNGQTGVIVYEYLSLNRKLTKRMMLIE